MITDRDKLGRCIAGEYTTFRTTSTVESSNYYIVPEYKVAIPVTATASDSFHLICEELGDWNLPETVTLLATVSHTVLTTALADYRIIPVLKEVLHTAPVKILTVMEKEAIADGKRRQSEAWIEERKPAKKVGFIKL